MFFYFSSDRLFGESIGLNKLDPTHTNGLKRVDFFQIAKKIDSKKHISK